MKTERRPILHSIIPLEPGSPTPGKQWMMTERILWAGVKLRNADDFHVSGFCPRAPASPNHPNCLSRFQVYRQGFVALVNSVVRLGIFLPMIVNPCTPLHSQRFQFWP